MRILRTPKGWTCPPEIDGLSAENSWRSHQVPLASARDTPEHLADRYHLVVDVRDRVPRLGERYAGLRQRMQDARVRARAYTREHGEDIPEVADCTWTTGRERQAREVNTGVGQVNPGAAATGGDNES